MHVTCLLLLENLKLFTKKKHELKYDFWPLLKMCHNLYVFTPFFQNDRNG